MSNDTPFTVPDTPRHGGALPPESSPQVHEDGTVFEPGVTEDVTFSPANAGASAAGGQPTGGDSRTDAAKEQASQLKDTATDEARNVAGTAKDEARNVAGTAKEEARNVAGTAKEEARNVAGEAKSQLASLYSESMHQLNSQATQQQERAATGLKSLSGEFRNMVSNSEGDGLATELVRRAADTTGAVGAWLGDRNPSGVLDDVRSFARRKPLAFIAIAAVTGLVAGRLTRSIAEAAKDDKVDELTGRSASADSSRAASSVTGREGGTEGERIANNVQTESTTVSPGPIDEVSLGERTGLPGPGIDGVPNRGTGF
jgi:vacuolar-type H+-ATPase subunit H